ncbi:MAG TPA: hypothetical protein VF528_16425 [Pyrinomonadaceae bacterium]
MITDCEPSYHARALYRRLSARPHRILYVGLDLQLQKYLQDNLAECWIVSAPAACVARLFIDKLNYSLLLFDNALTDATAQELSRYTRTLPHRAHTPIIILNPSQELKRLPKAITRLLPTPQPPPLWLTSQRHTCTCTSQPTAL